MKKRISSFIILLFYFTSASATWSIIMIDPKTNEIGIVGCILFL
jgi:hypothetical protein